MTNGQIDRATGFLVERQARFEGVQERDHTALMTMRDVIANNTSLIQRMGETQLAMGKVQLAMGRAQLALGAALEQRQLAKARPEKFIHRNGRAHGSIHALVKAPA